MTILISTLIINLNNKTQMKKVIFGIAALTMLYSCGSKSNSSETDVNSTDVEMEDIVDAVSPSEEIQDEAIIIAEEPEDDGYKAPIKVVVEYERLNAGYYKDIYTFNIGKNGKLSGTQQSFYRGLYDPENAWENRGTTEFGGKWSTWSISRGDGTQPVFAIDRSDRSQTIYLPNDCEYIWMCDDAWYECENWNTNKAMKVKSVEKL